jgi:hypothetical protein
MQSIDCAAAGRCTAVRFVLGQPDATTNQNLHFGLNGPSDVLFVGTNLLVADCRNHRVLLWRSIPTHGARPPDLVLGQPTLDTGQASYGGVSASSMNCPQSLAYGVDKKQGRGHLLVGDRSNGRVLIWHGLPTANYQPADVVLGQTTVTTSGDNNRAASTTMTDPSVAVSDDGRLLVSDTLNNRVLIWDDIPQQDDQPANHVLGQPNLDTGTVNNQGLVADPPETGDLNAPQGNASADATTLYVPDTGNDRILVWSPFPTGDGQAASLVLGQTSTAALNRNQAPSAATLNGPTGVSRAGSLLFVADQANNRVLMWNLPLNPLVNPTLSASAVLGQSDFYAKADNTMVLSASSLTQPRSVAANSQYLAVADTNNNRVLLYDLAALKTGQAASVVLGQPDFASNIASNVSPLGEHTLNGPTGIVGYGAGMIVSDQQNGRLLFFDQPPQSNADAPTAVWGQPDFSHGGRNNQGITGTNLCTPAGLATDGQRLFVADPCNHRVLMWNQVPTSPTQAADVVLGQSAANTGGVNGGAGSTMPNQHSLNAPQGVAVYGQRLVVADSSNNRVLIWNTLPTHTGQNADLVLGQADFVSNMPLPLDRTTLNGPVGVALDDTHLIVADTNSDRVLIWNSIPTHNQAPADVVLGQGSFVADQHLTPPNQASLRGPTGLFQFRGRLYVVDRGNNRVLYWNTLPTVSGQNADGLLGQPTYFQNTANYSGDVAHPALTAQSLSSPSSVFATVDFLYIADQANNRILVLGNPPLP